MLLPLPIPLFIGYSNPIFFEQIPGFHQVIVQQQDSSTGDKCHYDLLGMVQNVQERNQFNLFVDPFCKPPYLFLCTEGGGQQLTDYQHHNLMGYLALERASRLNK